MVEDWIERIGKFIFWLVVIVFIVFLVWVASRLMDFILGWSLYLWFFHKIREFVALPDLITGAMAVWCVAAVLLLGPMLLFSFFIRDRAKAIVIGATVTSVGMVFLYLISLFQADNLFNPYTREPNYVYVKESDGIIKLYPRGYLVDPWGRKTQPLTPEVADAYRKQQNSRRLAPPASPPSQLQKPLQAVPPPEKSNLTETPEKEDQNQQEAQPKTELSEAENQALINSPHRLVNHTGYPGFIFDGNKFITQIRPIQSIRVSEPKVGFWAILLVPDSSGVTRETRVRVEPFDSEIPPLKGWKVTTIPLAETSQLEAGIETRANIEETKTKQPIVIPRGTPINVRLATSLSTDSNSLGQEFTAYLMEPLVANGFVVAKRNALVKGIIVELKKAGRVRGVSSLSLRLVEIKSTNGTTIDIKTEVLKIEGKTTRGSDIAKILGGAATGAALGAITGSKRTAVEGAGAGAALGTTAVLATRGKSLELPVETVLKFHLTEAVNLSR